MEQDLDSVKSFQFLKKIDRLATMYNGHLKVIFTDDTEVVLMIGKRGPILPRRKRAYARSIGAIR